MDGVEQCHPLCPSTLLSQQATFNFYMSSPLSLVVCGVDDDRFVDLSEGIFLLLCQVLYNQDQ
jgi:hypothetical protein